MIRRRLAAAILCLGVLALGQPGALAQREVQPVERVAAITRPAVVYLEVSWQGWMRDRRDGKLWLEQGIQTGSTCSGSLVTPNGYVLTAGHCVEGELVVPAIAQGIVDAYVANGDVTQEDSQSFYDDIVEHSDVEGDGDAGAPFVPTVTVYRGIVEEGRARGRHLRRRGHRDVVVREQRRATPRC